MEAEVRKVGRAVGTFAGSLLLAVVLAAAAGAQGVDTEVEPSLLKPLAPRSLLLDGSAVDGRMVAVGERGHVLISDDDGASWRQVVVPTRATLTGVYFHDRELGWVVGHDAIILRTRDGGASWQRLYDDPEAESPLLDVFFEDAEHGFAVGAYGLFLETSDGGDTWSPVELSAGGDEDDEEDLYGDGGVDYHLNQLARTPGGRLYVAAEAGTIYRSDDEGRSWQTLPSPYEGSFFGVLPLEGESLLIFGLRGNLYRSDDGGLSWQAIDTDSVALLAGGQRLADGTLVIVGAAGTVLVSSDGGHVFRLVQRPDRQGLAAVLPAADGGLILIGEFGVQKIPATVLAGD